MRIKINSENTITVTVESNEDREKFYKANSNCYDSSYCAIDSDAYLVYGMPYDIRRIRKRLTD